MLEFWISSIEGLRIAVRCGRGSQARGKLLRVVGISDV